MTKNMAKGMSHHRLLPWIAAMAFFMQTLDTSILNTALPVMARDLNESPINMQSAIISYALTLALFIPISGFLADRFGTRTIFVTAIGFFSVGSLFCALSQSLFWLDASRIIQGVGGSMMVPVSRLTLIKSFKRHEFLTALNTSLTFGLIGSLLGPVLGGYLVQTLSWHWIFLINLPIGIVGIVAGMKFMPDVFGTHKPFDFVGAVLIGGAVISATMMFECINEGSNVKDALLLFLCSVLLVLVYRLYAKHAKAPLFPLELFKIPTFRIGLAGNLISRMGISAVPFLMPLLLQVVFGYSALTAGVLLMSMAVAAVAMKIIAQAILRYIGYRRVLLFNTMLVGGIIMSLALLKPQTPFAVIIVPLFLLGMSSSLQFTAMNSLALADLEGDLTSSGNSLVTVNQQLAVSFGIACGAALLRIFSETTGMLEHNLYYGFKATFLILGVMTALSTLIFRQLDEQAGRNLMLKIKKNL